MIHGWTVFFNGLWVAGLAMALAGLSLAAYRARIPCGAAWRGVLTQRRYRVALICATALVLVGATLSAWLV